MAKPRSVDLGPMYMDVGDASVHGLDLPSPPADAGDVSRFESLMDMDRRGRRAQPERVELTPGPLAIAPSPFADAEDLGAEIAYLWSSTGLTGLREVRVGLREQLLPGTSVRIYENAGDLRIDFTCGSPRVAGWLVGKLPALAEDLGARLDRRVALAVRHAGGPVAGEHGGPAN